MPTQKVLLIRHGETEWSLNGRHTGTTDIPLTEHGRDVARQWKPVLSQRTFALVLTSPLRRARETCELTGLGQRAEVDNDLHEWNYGEYEGITAEQILAQRPSWMIFRDGCPGGESPKEIQARIDRVIKKVRAVEGDVALFFSWTLSQVLWWALAWTPSRGRSVFPPRSRNGERYELLSGHACREMLECSSHSL